MSQTADLEKILELVRQLSPRERARLLSWLAPEVERDLARQETGATRSLLGLVKELGPAPSQADIDEVRREAWANFPRPDV